jgi:hypothetical protein
LSRLAQNWTMMAMIVTGLAIVFSILIFCSAEQKDVDWAVKHVEQKLTDKYSTYVTHEQSKACVRATQQIRKALSDAQDAVTERIHREAQARADITNLPDNPDLSEMAPAGFLLRLCISNISLSEPSCFLSCSAIISDHRAF